MLKFAKKQENKVMEEQELLSKIRSALINDSVAKDICKEYDIGNWLLKSVPIRFEKLEVSARTTDGNIILNKELKKKPFEIIMRYVIHELTHAVQHAKKDPNLKKDKKKKYLDKENEIEAFQNQIKYADKKRGRSKTLEYVDDLLEYHDIDGKKKVQKKKMLLEKLD